MYHRKWPGATFTQQMPVDQTGHEILPQRVAVELEGHSLHSQPGERENIGEITGWGLCAARSSPVCKQACSLGVRIRDKQGALARVPLSLFRYDFPPILFSHLLHFPTQDDTVPFPSVLGVQSIVSLTGERYLLLTVEYVILINRFPLSRQWKNIAEYAHHTACSFSSILKRSLKIPWGLSALKFPRLLRCHFTC